MRAWTTVTRQGTALAAAVVLPALAAVLGGLVHVSRCVPVSDGVGRLAIHLALLRPAADCPSGSLGVGGEPDQVLALALVLTAPAALGSLVGVLGAVGAHGLVRRALAHLAHLAPWRHLPGALPSVVVPRLLSRTVERTVRSVAPARAPLLRGPPRLALA
ncbi:hypothetical protein [Georgenia faecalis]|uniref:Uncharacterized protein n=1 Tax=Georgenia faecalis TaxID=2483799 RepID=A0ABV9D5E5_9MICO|nr:hypothetical protein [Georgenia faecalis]